MRGVHVLCGAIVAAVTLHGCTNDNSGASPEGDVQSAGDVAGIHVVAGKTAAQTFRDEETSQLADAACAGDVAGVRQATTQRADLNQRGLNGVTPLLWALHCESATGMEGLLEAGADPNLPFLNCSAVCVAAGLKNPEPLRVLLKHSGDPNARYSDSGWTALKMAFSLGVHSEKWDSYYALLDAGADINMVYNGSTIAFWAATFRRYDKVEELLDRGYSVALDYLASILEVQVDPGKEGSKRPNVARERLVERLKSLGVAFPPVGRVRAPTDQ